MSTRNADEIVGAISAFPTLEEARKTARSVTATPNERDQALFAWLHHSISEIRAADTWEKFKKLDASERFRHCKETTDAYIAQLHRIMRKDIESVRIPEDILRVNSEWAARKAYSKDMQSELGEKAREIVSDWRPEHHRGGSTTYI
jgi:hypothetical protein